METEPVRKYEIDATFMSNSISLSCFASSEAEALKAVERHFGKPDKVSIKSVSEEIE